MSLVVAKAEDFTADFAQQFDWYVDEAGEAVAWRFQGALEMSLLKLARSFDLGRVRRFRHPNLQGLRSYPMQRPFNKLLIFYRVNGNVLQAIRLMHGARDLPRRLAEPPGLGAD